MPNESTATPDRAIRESCERLAHLVWALANWNDHNFTVADHERWRTKARKEALHAESLLNARESSHV